MHIRGTLYTVGGFTARPGGTVYTVGDFPAHPGDIVHCRGFHCTSGGHCTLWGISLYIRGALYTVGVLKPLHWV